MYGEFTPIRVDGGTPAQRPAAPTLAAAGSDQFGHVLEIPKTAPGFKLRYDVRGVPGAAGATFEVSAPAAPTVYNSLNTVTNANGTVRDHDGVDTGSVVYRQLPTSSGTVALDAVKLGLAGSLNYSIRVFPTDRNGKVIGQASATSMLTLDDGLAPDGGLVASFAIQPGGTSAVSVFDPTTGGESLREYNASTGTYGRTFATDPPTLYQSGYQIIGIDPGVHRLLVLHWTNWGPYGQPCSAANPPSLQTYDTLTTKLVSDVSTGCQYTALGGRVDTVRHRAAILAHRTSDNADILLPLTLSTGSVGTPIEVDTNPDVQQAGEYHGIAMNRATGLVYLSRTDGPCFSFGPSALISVNLDSGVQTPAVAGLCVGGLDVDEGANQVFEDTDHASVNRFLPPTVTLSGFAGDTMNALDPMVVRPGAAIDRPRHRLDAPSRAYSPTHHRPRRGTTTRPVRPTSSTSPPGTRCPRSRASTSSPASGVASSTPIQLLSSSTLVWTSTTSRCSSIRPPAPGGSSPVTGGRSSSSSTSPRLLARQRRNPCRCRGSAVSYVANEITDHRLSISVQGVAFGRRTASPSDCLLTWWEITHARLTLGRRSCCLSWCAIIRL